MMNCRLKIKMGVFAVLLLLMACFSTKISVGMEAELARALELSRREAEERQRENEREEREMEEVIRLSLQEEQRRRAEAAAYTPIHSAALEGDLAWLKGLIEAAELRSRQQRGSELRARLGAGADIEAALRVAMNEDMRNLLNRRLPDGRTALHVAAELCRLEIVRYLLSLYPEIIVDEQGINAKDVNGNTALHLAALNNCQDVVRILLAAGANYLLPNRNGQTPWDLAMPYPTVDMIFVQHNDTIRRGLTPLLAAMHKGDPGEIAFLVASFADLNKKDVRTGDTPLHIASKMGRIDLATILLDGRMVRGERQVASINERNNDGDTPLHIAARNKNLEMVKLLLGRGAAQNITNKVGLVPLDLAPEFRDDFRAELPQEGFQEIGRLAQRHLRQAKFPHPLPRQEETLNFPATNDQIRIVPSLQQETTGEGIGDFCGYYSLWNASWFSLMPDDPNRINREALCGRILDPRQSFLESVLEDMFITRGDSAINPTRLTEDVLQFYPGYKVGQIFVGGFGNLDKQNVIRLIKSRGLHNVIAIDVADLIAFAITREPLERFSDFVGTEQADLIRRFIEDRNSDPLVIILGTGLKSGHWLTIRAERSRETNQMIFTVADSIYPGPETTMNRISPLIYALRNRWEMLRGQELSWQVLGRPLNEVLPELFLDVDAARREYPRMIIP